MKHYSIVLFSYVALACSFAYYGVKQSIKAIKLAKASSLVLKPQQTIVFFLLKEPQAPAYINSN